MGPVTNFDQGPQQNHAIFLAYDLENNPKWELNIGVGFELTPTTDPLVFKSNPRSKGVVEEKINRYGSGKNVFFLHNIIITNAQ